MTSSASQDVVDSEPPRKRQRLAPPPPPPSTSPTNATLTSKQGTTMDDTIKQTVVSDNGFQPERETQVGILHFVNEQNAGFTGTLKQRYTDFLVNEIAPDGTVVHLTDDKVPKFKDVKKVVEEQNRKPLADATNSTTEPNGEASSTGLKPEELPLPTPTPSENAFITASNNETTSSVTAEGPVAPLPVEEAPLVSLVASSNKNEDSFDISPDDHQLLTKYFGPTLKEELVVFHEKILAKPKAKPSTFGSLFSEPINDRPLRGRLHADVRRIFESRIETESMQDGKIKLSAAPPVKPHPEGYVRNQNPRQQNPRGQPKGQLGWQELGGQYLHFSLYKENKDTMEVISYLCRMLRVKPKEFAFAGTKDRRAVTVQRVSVYRQHAKALQQLNRDLRQARIGDFKHEKHRLELGELQGNQFIITLRDCHFGDNDSKLADAARLKLANEVVGQAVKHLQSQGFINYFGLQRFGTFGIGTDEIGKKILREDYEGAIGAILNVSSESLESAKNPERFARDRIARDDLDRALAIDNFKSTGKSHWALEKLPRKFSAESSIIRQLGIRPTDYPGALLMINRNLRTMYVHAYQSLVWNFVASKRWSRYGSKVIKGDLVLVDTPAEKAAEARDEVDENGEVVIHAAADDSAFTHDDLFQRARPLTWEDADSGKYSIFDIVLPTPGFDIEYPSNDIGDYYKEFMGSDRGGGLDPADMRRTIKDFSLSGSYRKLIGQVGKDLSFDIKTYHNENEQLVETDLEKLLKSRGQDPRVENAPRNHENRHDKNGRGGRGGRGGRQSDFYNNRPNSHAHGARQDNVQPPTQPPAKAPPRFGDHPTLNPDIVAAKMSAWQNLPAKLAADDKAAAAEWEARTPVNPDDVVQPVYKETFIETSAENEGRRTGYRSTQIVADGNVKDVAKEEADSETCTKLGDLANRSDTINDSAPATSGPDTVMEDSKAESVPATSDQDSVVGELTASALDEMEVETKASASLTSTPTTEKMAASFESIADSHDGGVKLSAVSAAPVKPSTPPTVLAVTEDTKDGGDKMIVHESPIQPPVEDISTAPAAETTLNNSDAGVVEPGQPAKIAVIIKFVLGTSQYATMALRELTGGIKTFKPDFSMGR